MRLFARALLVAGLIAPLMAGAQMATVGGTVYIDANANGVRDTGETGVARAVVSNQDTVVVTDATGAYHLPVGTTGVVFVSVPAGYTAVGAFWRPVAAIVDFPLKPVARAAHFTFIHASDTHIAPAVVARTERFRAIVIRGKPQFRHTVSNAKEILAIIGIPRYSIALGGHMHVREQLRYAGIPTRFSQTAAVVGPAGGGGMVMPSGITLYRVRAGKIDDGTFIPMGIDRK